MNDPENYMTMLCESNNVRLGEPVQEGTGAKVFGGLLVLAGIVLGKRLSDLKEYKALSKYSNQQIYNEYSASKCVSVIWHRINMKIIDMIGAAEETVEDIEDRKDPRIQKMYDKLARQESNMIMVAEKQMKNMMRIAKNDEDRTTFLKGAIRMQKKAKKVIEHYK